MILVPLLMARCGLDRRKAFACSVAIIFPLCALSAGIYFWKGNLDVMTAPRKELRLIEGCGHSPQGQLPEEFCQAVKHFLGDLK